MGYSVEARGDAVGSTKMNIDLRVYHYGRGPLSDLKHFVLVEKWPVNQPDDYGPLIHHAVHSRCALDNIVFLLDNGADVNAKEYRGVTPLYVAVEYDKVDVVKLLLRYGADTEHPPFDKPLMLALRLHRRTINIKNNAVYSLNTARALIEHGVRLHKQSYWMWMENLRVNQIDTVQLAIITFILCCRRTLVIDKNVVKHIAQMVWATLWDPVWRTLPDSGKRMC
jgi:hypothetical protein